MKILLAAGAALLLVASAAPTFAFDWNYGNAVGAQQGRHAAKAARVNAMRGANRMGRANKMGRANRMGRNSALANSPNPNIRAANRASRRAARAARQFGPQRPY